MPRMIGWIPRSGEILPAPLTGLWTPATRSSERDNDFLYNPENNFDNEFVDPAVIAKDEELRDTVTLQELLTIEDDNEDRPNEAITKDIKIPVFHINGTEELFFCGDRGMPVNTDPRTKTDTTPDNYCTSGKALTEFEGRFFSPKACFKGAVHKGASHDTTLHKNA